MNDFKNHPHAGETLLGVDFGLKVTGLALYKVGIDPIISTYGRILYQSNEQVIKEIQDIISMEAPDGIILGVPYFTDGKPSEMTRRVLEFAKRLVASINIPLFTQDESLSTFEAEERMKNDPKYNFAVDPKKIDEVAATIIIEEALQQGTKLPRYNG